MPIDLFEQSGIKPEERVEITVPPGQERSVEDRLTALTKEGKSSAEALKAVSQERGAPRDLFAEAGIKIPKPAEPTKVSRREAPPDWLSRVGAFAQGTALPYLGRTAMNVPGNIAEMGKGVVNLAEQLKPTAEQPIPGQQIAKGLGTFIGGGIGEGLRAISPELAPATPPPEVEAAGREFKKGIIEPIAGAIREPSTIPGKIAGYVEKRPVEAALDVLPFTKLLKTATTASEVSKLKNIQHAVETGFTKGIGGKMERASTFGKVKGYFTKAADTVMDIVRNKDKMKYLDEAGVESTGHLPQSVSDHAQAYAQRMSDIFNQYHAIAVEAGEAAPGRFAARSSLEPIATRLREIANDPVLLKESPGAAKYAAAKAERYFPSAGEPTGVLDVSGKPVVRPPSPAFYSPQQFEEAIKVYNESLAAWQKNPSYTLAKRAAIDGEVARMMRKQLDDMIMKATGKEYQELKNLYGAYKESEKDVLNRFKKEASKAGSRELINITDIYSIGETLTGIMTGHPLMIAKGGAFMAAKKGMQAYWSPDRYVKAMFERVEDLMKPSASAAGVIARSVGPAETIARKAPLSDEELATKIKEWVEKEQKKKKEE